MDEALELMSKLHSERFILRLLNFLPHKCEDEVIKLSPFHFTFLIFISLYWSLNLLNSEEDCVLNEMSTLIGIQVN